MKARFISRRGLSAVFPLTALLTFNGGSCPSSHLISSPRISFDFLINLLLSVGNMFLKVVSGYDGDDPFLKGPLHSDTKFLEHLEISANLKPFFNDVNPSPFS
jgi:hypothetical protein